LDISHHIFHNLDHEDTIIALSGHSGVCKSHILTKTVAGKVSLATASFPAYVYHAVKIPNYEALVNAAHHQNLMLNSFRVGEDLLYPIVANIESKSPC
jgi:hypothetical protein